MFFFGQIRWKIDLFTFYNAKKKIQNSNSLSGTLVFWAGSDQKFIEIGWEPKMWLTIKWKHIFVFFQLKPFLCSNVGNILLTAIYRVDIRASLSTFIVVFPLFFSISDTLNYFFYEKIMADYCWMLLDYCWYCRQNRRRDSERHSRNEL